MSHFILRLPGNREELIYIPTHKITEDIADIFSLISTAAHTGVDQYVIHDAEENDDDDAVMDDVDESKSGYRLEKESMDEVLDDEEAGDMEEDHKEQVGTIVAESKPHFTKI